MGVTIHFEGRLSTEDGFAELKRIAVEHANDHGWRVESIDADHVKLARVHVHEGEEEEEEWDYEGPVRGIALYLHEDCDPIRLEFDRDWYIQEFTKTQFAGPEIHKLVVEFLRKVQSLFVEFKVFDEGEFWESGDIELVRKHIFACEQAIADELQKHPDAQVKVKLESGRIMDMVE